jgi:hypothetical protein
VHGGRVVRIVVRAVEERGAVRCDAVGRAIFMSIQLLMTNGGEAGEYACGHTIGREKLR